MSVLIDGVYRSAVISTNGLYRYHLGRVWDSDAERCLFVMLNPSTADGREDDATIRRCIGFAKGFGFGALDVVNLFALRTRSPKKLAAHPFPVGPENDEFVERQAGASGCVVCGWGVRPKELADRGSLTALLLTGVDLYCLGTTKDGSPRHPLYLPAASKLERWEP